MAIHVINILSFEFSLDGDTSRTSLIDNGAHLLLEKSVLRLDLLDNENDLFGSLRQLPACQ